MWFKTVEKAELSKFSWYLKRKLGVTMHFSELKSFNLKKNKNKKKKTVVHCFVFYWFLEKLLLNYV